MTSAKTGARLFWSAVALAWLLYPTLRTHGILEQTVPPYARHCTEKTVSIGDEGTLGLCDAGGDPMGHYAIFDDTTGGMARLADTHNQESSKVSQLWIKQAQTLAPGWLSSRFDVFPMWGTFYFVYYTDSAR